MAVFTIDQVARIIPNAERLIEKERLSWEPIYNLIWSYVDRMPDLLIGGTVAVEVLLGSKVSYFYQLFSPRALQHANDLTNELSELCSRLYGDPLEALKSTDPNPEAKILMMKTLLPNNRYGIFINSRQFVEIIQIPSDSVKIIEPVLSQFGDHKPQLISPEVLLLDLYRGLYSPNRADDWPELLKIESSLYSHLKQRLPEIQKRLRADGGSVDRKAVQAEIISWMQDRDVVLIGEHALQILLDYRAKHPVVQMIAQDPAQVAETLQKMFSGTVSRRPLHIMSDFRLERVTVRMDDKEIAYIYNAASYDLIPWNPATRGNKMLRIGNPFVLLRFLLVDFWTVRLFLISGKIDKGFAQNRIDQIIMSLLSLRSQLSLLDDKPRTGTLGDKFIGLGEELLRVFQTDHYSGIYESEAQAQKNLNREGKHYFDYYPDLARAKTGSMRKLER